MESLEERALLSISPTDLAAVEQLFPNYEVADDVNCIYVSEASDFTVAEQLRRAVDEAGRTECNDIIFLRTSGASFGFDTPLTIDIDAGQFGSVMIVGLDRPATFVSQGTDRVVDIAAGSHALLGNLYISRGDLSQIGGNGAGIRSVGAEMELSSVFITACSTGQQGYGGAIYQQGGSSILNNVQMEYNRGVFGGGMAVVGGTSTQTNVRYEGNNYTHSFNTSMAGGAVYAENADLTMTGAMVNFNKAGRGAGIFLDTSTASITNATVSRNYGISANSVGSGIDVLRNVDLTLNNSIVLGNFRDTSQTLLGDIQFFSGSIQFDNNIIGTYLSYNNKFDTATNRLGLDRAEDVFQDLDLFRLAAGSVAVNAGNNAFVQGVATDIAGNARIQQGTVDLGAWESAFASAVLGADLAPVTPDGWESPLIVSSNPYALADNAEFVPDEPLFIRWAARNIGGEAGDSGFNVLLKVDGNIVWTGGFGAGIPSGFTLRQDGISIPGLSIGEHTIEMVIDPENLLGEIDETNNVFSKTIYVSGPQADLTPFAPEGWSAPLVLSTQPNSIVDSDVIRPYESFFVTWGLKNIGDAYAERDFRVTLFVDGQERWHCGYPAGLPVDYFLQHRGIYVPGLGIGEHTIEMRIDSDNTVNESNETNNVYTRTLTIVEPKADLTFKTPDGWDAPVQLTQEINGVPRETFLENVPIRLNACIANIGSIYSYGTDLEIWVDGQYYGSAWIDGMYEGREFVTYDYDLYLSAGRHTVELRIDPGNYVNESNETNNVFSLAVDVAGPAPDLTPFAQDNWSSPVVCSNQQHSVTETDVYDDRPFYVSWGLKNVGTTYARNSFKVALFVDGREYWSNVYPPGLPVDFFLQYRGIEIAGLSAGEHTVELRIDGDNTVAELNEDNNVYVRTVNVQETPSTVTDLRIRYSNQETIALTWTAPDSAGSFIVQRSTDGQNWTAIGQGIHDQPAWYFYDRNFDFDTTYYYRVVDGTKISNVTTVRSAAQPVAYAVTDLAAEVVLHTGVNLTWTGTSGYGLYYVVQRRESGTGGWTDIGTVRNADSFKDVRPDADKSYDYRIVSHVYGGDTAVSAVVAAEKYVSPYDMEFFTPTGWAAPVMVLGRETNFAEQQAFYTNDSVSVAFGCRSAGSVYLGSVRATIYVDDVEITTVSRTFNADVQEYFQGTYSISSLSAGTHTIKVVLDKDGLIEEYNEENNVFSTTVTVIGKPEMPAGLTAELLDNRSVKVSWDAVPFATSYRLIYSDGSGWKTIETEAAEHVFRDLALHTGYTFRVAAVNPSGESAFSLGDSVVTPWEISTSPTLQQGFDLVGLDSVPLYIRFDNVDATRYAIEEALSPDGPWTTVLSKNLGTGTTWETFRRTGLSEDTTYYYRAYVVNPAGQSEYSDMIAITTEVGKPGAPTGVTTELTAEGKLRVSWQAVDKASSYVLRCSSGGTTVTIDVGDNNWYEFDSPENYHAAWFSVQAVNRAGTSDTSASFQFVMPPVAPTAPDVLTVSVRSSSQIDVSWNAVEEAASYRVERAIAGSGSWKTVYSGSATEFSNTGLSADTNYVYRVIAEKDGVVSDASQTATAKTQKSGTAAVPTGLQSTKTTRNSITVSWGGNTSYVSDYVVQWSADGVTWKSATVKKNVKTYNITGLAAGTEYLIRVSANSKAGRSEWSDPIAVQTEALPVKPNAPTGLKLASKTSRSATISWTPPASDLTGYRIEYSQGGGSWSTLTVGADATEATISGLKSGKTYSIRIVALNGDVLSDYSSMLTVKI